MDALGNPALHMTLTSMAARNAGLDLNTALASGQLTANAHAKMITRCRSCPVAGTCEVQLAQGVVPEGCPNAEVFEALG